MIPPTSERALEIAAIHVIRIYQSAAFARDANATEIIPNMKSKLTHSAFSSACSAACLCDTAVEFKTIPHPAQRQGVFRSRVRESCSASASAAASANDTETDEHISTSTVNKGERRQVSPTYLLGPAQAGSRRPRPLTCQISHQHSCHIHSHPGATHHATPQARQANLHPRER